MSVAFSGVSRCAEPSRCDRKCAPCSSISAPRGEAEHLIAAAVGQDRLRPADEAVQPAAPRDQIVAGPQVQMVGVAEQNLSAERFQIAMRDAFHGALRAHRHERRRLDIAVRRRHHAAPRAPVAVRHAKAEWCHLPGEQFTIRNWNAEHHLLRMPDTGTTLERHANRRDSQTQTGVLLRVASSSSRRIRRERSRSATCSHSADS